MIAVFIGNPTASGIDLRQLAANTLAAPARHLKLVAPALALAKGENGMLTVAGYCEQRGVNLSVRDMSRIGRRAAALSRKGGLLITRVQDVFFGEVNAYDPEVLVQAYEEIDVEAAHA